VTPEDAAAMLREGRSLDQFDPARS
jgi:hypothetical protein